MSGLEAGYRFPDLVRAGIHLILNPPVNVAIRVDPDGERKWEDRRRRNQEATERRYGPPSDRIRRSPPIKTIHLQWLDASHEPVWRDTAIHIDPERRRFHQVEGWLIGQERHGSGAIGVLIFSAPVLLALSPYLAVRSRLYRSKERKRGMSRHGIALLEKLKGRLDAETEALLAETLRNEWRVCLKLDRAVGADEAAEVLRRCDLTVRVGLYGHADPPMLMGDFIWLDDEGDLTGHIQFIGSTLHFAHVLRSQFTQDEVRTLIGRYRTCRVLDGDEERSPA